MFNAFKILNLPLFFCLFIPTYAADLHLTETPQEDPSATIDPVPTQFKNSAEFIQFSSMPFPSVTTFTDEKHLRNPILSMENYFIPETLITQIREDVKNAQDILSDYQSEKAKLKTLYYTEELCDIAYLLPDAFEEILRYICFESFHLKTTFKSVIPSSIETKSPALFELISDFCDVYFQISPHHPTPKKIHECLSEIKQYKLFQLKYLILNHILFKIKVNRNKEGLLEDLKMLILIDDWGGLTPEEIKPHYICELCKKCISYMNNKNMSNVLILFKKLSDWGAINADIVLWRLISKKQESIQNNIDFLMKFIYETDTTLWPFRYEILKILSRGPYITDRLEKWISDLNTQQIPEDQQHVLSYLIFEYFNHRSDTSTRQKIKTIDLLQATGLKDKDPCLFYYLNYCCGIELLKKGSLSKEEKLSIHHYLDTACYGFLNFQIPNNISTHIPLLYLMGLLQQERIIIKPFKLFHYLESIIEIGNQTIQEYAYYTNLATLTLAKAHMDRNNKWNAPQNPTKSLNYYQNILKYPFHSPNFFNEALQGFLHYLKQSNNPQTLTVWNDFEKLPHFEHFFQNDGAEAHYRYGLFLQHKNTKDASQDYIPLMVKHFIQACREKHPYALWKMGLFFSEADFGMFPEIDTLNAMYIYLSQSYLILKKENNEDSNFVLNDMYTIGKKKLNLGKIKKESKEKSTILLNKEQMTGSDMINFAKEHGHQKAAKLKKELENLKTVSATHNPEDSAIYAEEKEEVLPFKKEPIKKIKNTTQEIFYTIINGRRIPIHSREENHDLAEDLQNDIIPKDWETVSKQKKAFIVQKARIVREWSASKTVSETVNTAIQTLPIIHCIKRNHSNEDPEHGNQSTIDVFFESKKAPQENLEDEDEKEIHSAAENAEKKENNISVISELTEQEEKETSQDSVSAQLIDTSLESSFLTDSAESAPLTSTTFESSIVSTTRSESSLSPLYPLRNQFCTLSPTCFVTYNDIMYAVQAGDCIQSQQNELVFIQFVYNGVNQIIGAISHPSMIYENLPYNIPLPFTHQHFIQFKGYLYPITPGCCLWDGEHKVLYFVQFVYNLDGYLIKSRLHAHAYYNF